MPNVDININDRIYKVTCDEGQEDRLQMLAAWADERVQLIAEEVGQIGDNRLMLLTLLMICDELFELKDKVKSFENASDPLDPDSEAGAAKVIDAATARINAIVEGMDETA